MSSEPIADDFEELVTRQLDRPVIAQAIGVLMHTSAVPSEEATRHLDGLVDMTGLERGDLARMIVHGCDGRRGGNSGS